MKYKIFDNAEQLCQWVNVWGIEVVSIIHKKGYRIFFKWYNQKYVLFYLEVKK